MAEARKTTPPRYGSRQNSSLSSGSCFQDEVGSLERQRLRDGTADNQGSPATPSGTGGDKRPETVIVFADEKTLTAIHQINKNRERSSALPEPSAKSSSGPVVDLSLAADFLRKKSVEEFRKRNRDLAYHRLTIKPVYGGCFRVNFWYDASNSIFPNFRIVDSFFVKVRPAPNNKA
jgi:hypothetical protein